VEALFGAGAKVHIFACCYLNRHEHGEQLLAADSNLALETTPNGRTALHFACQKGNGPIGPCADSAWSRRQCAGPRRQEAAHGGPWKPEADQESINIPLDSGADVGLHTAAAIGRPEKVKAALDANNADLDQYDESGCTALYHAAHNNHLN